MMAQPLVHSDASRSDADLAVATRAGDASALAALYERHSQALFAVAYRLLNSRESAEDVIHDVFVGLPEALRKYDERGSLKQWLGRVTASVALSRMRRERTASEVEFGEHLHLSLPRSEPHERITLQDAIARLPDSLRAVLVLKEIEGYSHAEIASMLGISRGASEVRLHRALRALRDLLNTGDKS